MSKKMNKMEMARLASQAMNGNKNATAQIVAKALPTIANQYASIKSEIKDRRENEWDEEEAREMVMDADGELPEEWTVGAFSDVMSSLLQLLALTPAALMADEGEADTIGGLWNDTAVSLFIKLHNPTVRYGIIAGFRPELRDDAEEYFERMGREVWGTLDVLVESDEVNVEDFPPETGHIIKTLGQNMAQNVDGNQMPGRGD